MKDLKIGLLVFLFLTLVTGFAYPLTIDRLANEMFSDRARGSIVLRDGKPIGSLLLGQEFKRPEYFWGRPSAVAFQPLPSGGSNLSGSSEALRKQIDDRKKEGRTGDLLFASASGVDPEISPESAFAQIPRIAAARKLGAETLARLVEANVAERTLGFLGERRVNVLRLNLALDRLRE
ncbi:MAG: potassium-transporting ATPase subunit KdpC [Bdellovibrionales bacterium]|nr:potassium-transporting ATPase subunit KdpC [Bdellovibrionales bacterium]